MNKKIIITILAVVLLVITAVILITDRGYDVVDNNQNQDQNVNAEDKADKPIVPRNYTSTGTVKSVSTNSIVVTVQVLETGTDGFGRFVSTEKNILINSDTKINVGGKTATLTDIKTGNKITITSTEDLTNNSSITANLIEVSK